MSAPLTPGSAAAVAKGDALPSFEVRLTRGDLVRYAGASGDLNPIHWSDRVAGIAGLPGVIAHGMLSMALAGRVLTAWTGDPASVRSYGTRFTRPVVVPDDDSGAVVELGGTVAEVRDEDGVRIAVVDLKAIFDGRTVLGRARAEVVLPH
ncbi:MULTISPECIES: MaoC/PaaZ C-terminal domain-containing protein [Pseudonocardia]|uniref:Bifunctional enoyl-CoA hydratase/phosphate acetyltransferase n=2 Tax=Pseudonocardia TaxID=1847 RepID=A0A1Y2N104_PSEAH|nr:MULTISPECIES: MaoC/PaaZ C-terminal domain-containing protein [Pseudonocardia]OSY40941.1 bifunctional enoyl-CoA hydratase/phosphate acetyltransferase [Pseudonocardia autotrophica]TDN73929.1 acyl dehydratase [Pseudonocardia autotrophica]BBG04682.1 MaoC family dehydratase [Pseudonocardia autotrophica]GEC28777.1 MaoC family dehydratase [Pseudonocardia saturnea]